MHRALLAGLAGLALLTIGGCATLRGNAQRSQAHDRIAFVGARASGQYLPVEPRDFPGGDVAQGKPSTPGSQLLSDAFLTDQGVPPFVRSNGLPDAIAIDGGHHSVLLGYGERRMVYVFRGEPLPVAQRELFAEEVDQVVPDRRLTKQAERLQGLLQMQARVLRVGRRLVRVLPAAGGGKPGEYHGLLTMGVTPAGARLFGVSPDAEGRIVAWVDPDGPAAGRLQAGDLITHVNGVPVAVRDKTHAPEEGPIALTVMRAGQAQTVPVVPESWPRPVVLFVLRGEQPNAAATEGGIVVTTSLIELLPDDDQLAFVLGHELAHISEGHVEKKVTPGSVLKGLVNIGVVLPADIVLPGSGQLIGAAVQGVENRFNRDQERDADRLGVRYAAAAGYDPNAALTFMELMETKAPVGSVTQFLDIHPPYPERKEILRAEVAALAR